MGTRAGCQITLRPWMPVSLVPTWPQVRGLRVESPLGRSPHMTLGKPHSWLGHRPPCTASSVRPSTFARVCHVQSFPTRPWGLTFPVMGSCFLGDFTLEPRPSPGSPGCADIVRVPGLSLEAHRCWIRVLSGLWMGLGRALPFVLSAS